MSVEWLINELQKADPKDEVFLIVEDPYTFEVMQGVAYKVIRAGEGSEANRIEIFTK